MTLLRKLGTQAGLLVLWLVHFLPLPWIGVLGAALGSVLYRFGRGRVTRINLALCFPEMPEAQRHALGERHFRMLGRNALELSVMTWGTEEELLRMTKVEGLEHLKAVEGRPVIALAPHFIGLNMGGIRVAYEYPGTASIYSRQKNPTVDRVFLKARTRFGAPHLVSRQEGLRSVIRVVKSGKPFYFLPDMDFGRRDAVFVPFFGVETATITTLPRLARLAGAVVIPVVTRQVGDGYVVKIYPPWEDYPTDDVEADVRRMNAFIEERVREMPEQYFWAHKRFKTRPPGEASPYRRK
ncbi:MAG TPA: lipid A biosynthesis acyltransferase [Usitatibacter sp.]|jgi:KDO2-lipid IV(A) lauroyltransferase|nr:lipid A biosynthesis acyltransferase [Usitatibacter sp.]